MTVNVVATAYCNHGQLDAFFLSLSRFTYYFTSLLILHLLHRPLSIICRRNAQPPHFGLRAPEEEQKAQPSPRSQRLTEQAVYGRAILSADARRRHAGSDSQITNHATQLNRLDV